MRGIESNGVKIYELTKDAIIPDVLCPKRQKKLLKKHSLISNRMEVIQDLGMPDISTKISLSPDGKYLFVLGAYSPRVRCYEFEQMSMKFERNVNELPSKIAFIERDYSHFVLLEGHKTLAFHSQGGEYKKIRCDDVVTDLIYSRRNNKIFAPSSKGHISIVDLEDGKLFNKFIAGNSLAGINCASYNENSDLFFCGTKSGLVDGYDPRTDKKIGSIDITIESNPEDMKSSYKPEVAKLAFKNNFLIGVGTDKGVVLMYDIRNKSRPWSSRDLDYRRPISSIIFNDDKVVSSVGSVVKIWTPHENNEGEIFATFDTNKQLNDFFQYPDSGLFFAATNEPQLPVFFIPRLGDAPRWVQTLSNLVVNMSVEDQSLNSTHVFVTLEELDELHLKHLIGTASLTAYTHGYYISSKTYRLAKAAIERLVSEEVNKDAEFIGHSLSSKPKDDDEIPDPTMNVAIKDLLVHNKFESLFENSEFIVDPTNKEFERVIVQSKILEKRKHVKRLRKEKALRSHKLTKTDGSEVEQFDDESDSESD